MIGDFSAEGLGLFSEDSDFVDGFDFAEDLVMGLDMAG
jgi:hypothetical protein